MERSHSGDQNIEDGPYKTVCESADSIELTQDRAQCWDFVKTGMNLRIP
jgi:sugar diacid utilization regulator